MALRGPNMDFSPQRERPELPGEDEIRQLRHSAEKRCMALAHFYRHLNLSPEQLHEVEDELRKARMYEVLKVTSTMREAELDEIRRQLLAQEQVAEERRRQLPVQVQLLRQRAFEALQHEAAAARAREAERLADDRRLLLQREKEVLMQRRRRFEVDHLNSGGGGGGGSSSGGGGGGGGGGAVSAPVLVMNVALGNGKEDRLVVRQRDDPKKVAALFARKHKLPDHAIANLAAQIRAHTTSSSSSSSHHHHQQQQNYVTGTVSTTPRR